jgi:hypothetical protein
MLFIHKPCIFRFEFRASDYIGLNIAKVSYAATSVVKWFKLDLAT